MKRRSNISFQKNSKWVDITVKLQKNNYTLHQSGVASSFSLTALPTFEVHIATDALLWHLSHKKASETRASVTILYWSSKPRVLLRAQYIQSSKERYIDWKLVDLVTQLLISIPNSFYFDWGCARAFSSCFRERSLKESEIDINLKIYLKSSVFVHDQKRLLYRESTKNFSALNPIAIESRKPKSKNNADCYYFKST